MLLVCASLMKTGSTWWVQLADEFLSQHGGVPADEVRRRYRLGRVIRGDEFRLGSLRAHKLAAIAPAAWRSPPFSAKTHAPATPSFSMAKCLGLVDATLNVRDPRDQAVSVLDHAHARRANPASTLRWIETMRQAIDFVATQESVYDSWQSRGATIIRYEDLYDDPVAEVRRLGAVVDLPVDLEGARAVVAAVRSKIAGGATVTKFNIGGSGRHREAMSARDLQYAEDRLGPMISAMGYG